MNKIVIYSDSTCDLSKKLIDKHGIKIMPLYVTFDQEMYKDGIDINAAGLYKKVDEYKRLPKTSAASVGDFITLFDKELKEGNDIVFFTIGSTLSSTYQNALIAKENCDASRIEIIDSLNLSSAIGLQVLKACKFRDQGMNIHQIKEEITKITDKVRARFAIE